jgi:hypothetical protein
MVIDIGALKSGDTATRLRGHSRRRRDRPRCRSPRQSHPRDLPAHRPGKAARRRTGPAGGHRLSQDQHRIFRRRCDPRRCRHLRGVAGTLCGVKASGGIRTLDHARAMLEPALTGSAPAQVRVEPLQSEFLLRLADALNTTLDLQHPHAPRRRPRPRRHRLPHLRHPAAQRPHQRPAHALPDRPHRRGRAAAIKMGKGIVGQAAQTRQAHARQRRPQTENYINANPAVRSELAVPLIVKNRSSASSTSSPSSPTTSSPSTCACSNPHRLAHRAVDRERAPLHPRRAPGADPFGDERDQPRAHQHPRSRPLLERIGQLLGG